MSSGIISRFLERFSSRAQYCAVMLGLDGAGKTTLLYRLKLGIAGEVVQTIPSIGFNVESVRLQAGRDGRVLNLTCWDVGGCGRSHMIPFFAQYVEFADAIIWLVDSSDRERLDDSIEEYTEVMKRVTTDGTKERPVLILATKQDARNPMSLDEIRTRIAPAVAGRQSFSIGTTLTQSLTDGPLSDAFGWLLAALEGRAVPAGQSANTPGAPSALEDRFTPWLVRAEGDSPENEFLHQFETLTLPAWDHYTHIRIAYVLLSRFGRQKGMCTGLSDIIFDGLERYITQSAQTRGRTFHVTMTYFWIQMVHFGIRSTPAEAGEREFVRFLLVNPFVADGNLWAQYYSKGLMMSAEAKAGMVLPDVKALPNLVVRDAIPRN
ncbi:ADP-ribosylation factor [Mycena pura]|uniref:ADP-ribosylation factor n=1 Tax=Mycena pura TaxID=153505 RepID=A0AAD6Y826_9AGAR|nr:ADP-ribosylation factor [Mycena pura]